MLKAGCSGPSRTSRSDTTSVAGFLTTQRRFLMEENGFDEMMRRMKRAFLGGLRSRRNNYRLERKNEMRIQTTRGMGE